MGCFYEVGEMTDFKKNEYLLGRKLKNNITGNRNGYSALKHYLAGT